MFKVNPFFSWKKYSRDANAKLEGWTNAIADFLNENIGNYVVKGEQQISNVTTVNAATYSLLTDG